jgi:hypothetical protein
MRSFGNTGPTVPAWISERIRRREEAWPLAVLSAGLVAVLALSAAAGVWIWTSDASVVYALP